MSLDLEHLWSEVTAHGPVARVLVVDAQGSTPREAGAAMVVRSEGQSGTIGGGALEYEASDIARSLLSTGGAHVSRHPLGPALGQCCGGAVTLVTEVIDAELLNTWEEQGTSGVVARAVEGPDTPPLQLSRRLADLRAGKKPLNDAELVGGWLIEPLTQPGIPLWVYGAGHVGQAVVNALAPLPQLSVTWVDTTADRFPEPVPEGVTVLPAADLVLAARHAPDTAHHLVLTFSHSLDLELCHALLGRPAASIGLIGSETKWARFRTRLRDLGHTDQSLSRIACPIGDPSLGKHPQAIALGVGTALLSHLAAAVTQPQERSA